MAPVQFGIDILLQSNPSWKNKNLGMVTNHAATTNQLEPSRKALQARKFNLVKLFSPEHGLDSMGPDGFAMHDGFDDLTKIPVISLYGNKLSPAGEDLKDIDILLFDIPDIGSRFYTYLWTLTHVMEACSLYQKQLIILDRPNPISGIIELAEGPFLVEEHCSSFIGRWELPVRHSCTLGELANYFNATRHIGCDLQVIRCENWNRSTMLPGWSQIFVPTSPAINSFDSALLYPGLCFLEATNISEGRGTPSPFRIVGATWMNNHKIAGLINKNQLLNLYAKPVEFSPQEGNFKMQACKGMTLQVENITRFHPVKTGMVIIKLIKDLHGDSFQWAPYPTHVNSSGRKHLDLLTGLPDSEKIFDLNSGDFDHAIRTCTSTDRWPEMIGPYLLYA